MYKITKDEVKKYFKNDDIIIYAESLSKIQKMIINNIITLRFEHEPEEFAEETFDYPCFIYCNHVEDDYCYYEISQIIDM